MRDQLKKLPRRGRLRWSGPCPLTLNSGAASFLCVFPAYSTRLLSFKQDRREEGGGAGLHKRVEGSLQIAFVFLPTPLGRWWWWRVVSICRWAVELGSLRQYPGFNQAWLSGRPCTLWHLQEGLEKLSLLKSWRASTNQCRPYQDRSYNGLIQYEEAS